MRLRRFPVTLLLAILVACNPASRSTASPDESAQASAPSPGETSASPETSVPVEPTDEPAATPTPTPSADPSEPSPSASAGSGAAAACSGSDQNREFFEAAVAALDWTVYCAVLPSGWFVDSGEYRRAGEGRLEIAYRGPGGARFELHEGAFCADASGCVPSGAEIADAPFDGQTGTLIAADTGGWALVVDADAAISWLAIGTGVDERTFRAFTAGVAIVDG